MSGGTPDGAPARLGAIRAVVEPGRTRVVLSGDVDASLRDEASAAMARAMVSSQPVVVDAAELRFIDSTGIAFLLQLAMAAREASIPLGLWDPRRVVLDLLDILGMADQVPVAAGPSGVDAGSSGVDAVPSGVDAVPSGVDAGPDAAVAPPVQR